MIKIIIDEIYAQFRGLIKAGKRIVPAQNRTELIVSRIIGIVLFLFSILFIRVIFTLDYLPLRIYIRVFIVIAPLMTFAFKFYRGISISWILAGLRRYWIPVAVLVYTYITLGLLIYYIFADAGSMAIGLTVGFFLVLFGSVLAVVFGKRGMEVGKDRSANSDRVRKMKVFGYLLYTLLWIAFIIGGFISISWATGFMDWFLKSVLGW